MAKLTKKEEHIVEMYVRYFGRVATKDEIKSFDDVKTLSEITAEVRVNAANESGLKGSDYLNSIIQNLFGRSEANAFESKYAKKLDDNVYYNLPIATIIKKGSKDDKGVYTAKKLVAEMIATKGGSYELANINQDNYLSIYSAKKGLLVSTVADLEAKISNVPDIINGKTYTLTADVNTGKVFVGTAKNDLFLATKATDWSVGDSLDGGKGTDKLKIIDTGAISISDVPVGGSLKNVEILDLISGNNVNVNSTSIDGLTLLNITSKTTTAGADNSATASATTDIRVTDTNADTTNAANTITVNGGKDVTVVSKNNGAGDTGGAKDNITVGNTTAAAGKVSVTSTGADVATGINLGDITVNGGTEITVNQYAGKTAGTGNNIGGAVTVNGNASTTTVTVNQTATATGAIATATAAAVVGYTAGAVTIDDVNAGTANANTISTVTLKNAGAATVDSNALSTLNLEGTLVTVDTTNSSTATTPAVTTLALNLKGATSTGAVTADTEVTTLNIDSSTKASTLADLVANSATKINVSGDAALTLTDNNFAAAKDIVVTNTAGVTFGTTAIGADVTFTGGAGNDTITLTDEFTKAITLGAGNDKVTIVDSNTNGVLASTTAGKKGSVNAGDGEDTIVLTATTAATVSTNSAFNTAFSGFDVLELTGVTTNIIDLDGINGVDKVKTTGAGTLLTLNNMDTNGRLTITGTSAAVTVGIKGAVLSTTDVLNIDLENSGAVAVAFGKVTAANVETININTVDKGTVANVAATKDSATLEAASATSIVVTGNNGLTLINDVGNTKVTNFDASGVVANGTADTAANLAVTFTSGNATATANVTIKGGAGNDTLTGNAAIDTITGGAGNDTLAGAGGADIINVGEGRDAILINSFVGVGTDSGTASFDTINGFKLASAFTTSTDIVDIVKFQAATVGGANASVLAIDMDTDGSNTNQLINVEGDATGAGQHAGVTYTIKAGILTLGGAGASTVDTLGEWLAEAAAVAATNGDALAFQFGSDTYVFGQNGSADVFVKLAGVTGVAALAEGTGTSTGVDNTLWFVDFA